MGILDGMDRYSTIGTVLCLAGLAGYVAGVYVTYPGRAFAVTAFMIGITLFAIALPSGEVA